MSGKKHILILPRWFPNRTDVQSGSFILNQAVLNSERFQVSVIYVHGVTGATAKFECFTELVDGVNIIRVYFRTATGLFRKILNARRYRKAQWIGMERIRTHVDLCHVHVPYRSAFLAEKLLARRIPFVITEHWSGHVSGEYEKKNALDKMLYVRLLSKAKKISTVSEFLRSAFKRNTGFDSVVIPNYIIEGHLSHLGSVFETIQILCVADLYDATKNISGLLRAYRRALEELCNSGRRFELTIIGGGPDEEKIHLLAQDLKFKPGEIRFTGRMSHTEVLDAYSVCDFYVCNSNIETFGMAVAEALMVGKPVICTTCGGPEEFISEEDGILISVGNEPGLTAAIVEMTKKYDTYKCVEIRDRVTQRFGREAVLAKWVKFYED